MKSSILAVIVVLGFFAVFTSTSLAAGHAGKMRSYSGEVTAVDPGGAGITVDVDVGGKMMTVGAIVDQDTKIRMRGKKADLKDVAVGDKVTIRYLKSDNLYAKSIAGR